MILIWSLVNFGRTHFRESLSVLSATGVLLRSPVEGYEDDPENLPSLASNCFSWYHILNLDAGLKKVPHLDAVTHFGEHKRM